MNYTPRPPHGSSNRGFSDSPSENRPPERSGDRRSDRPSHRPAERRPDRRSGEASQRSGQAPQRQGVARAPAALPLFVTCGHGLEPLLHEELTELGFANVSEGYRGVYVEDSSFESIYRINYCSRIAGRVLLPIKQFRCYDRDTLYRQALEVDWLRYIGKGRTFAIDSNVSHKTLRNSLFAAQVVKDAICDQFRERTGQRPSVDSSHPQIQLNLFIHHENAVLSFDTSGQPLYKRGYRQQSGEAPMQETLAAALLRMAKYRGDEIFLDPCCGSGTLLIEAALIASRTAPGFLRKEWGFTKHPHFSMQTWLQVKGEADSQRIPLLPEHFFGIDVDFEAVRMCKANLRAVGFHSLVDIAQEDVRVYAPEIRPNFVITNPPYGRRLDDVEHLRALYRSLGDFLKRMTAKPARGFIFTGSYDLTKEVGLATARRYVIESGGIEARLLEFDLYDASGKQGSEPA